ncbi:MAG: hypothetical protein WD749_03710 [Phycisphaerales bacterium]
MWMQKVRLRVFALLVGAALAAIATASLTALPVWPLVGVAVAAVALGVSKMTSRLKQPTCWGCGGDLSREPAGSYGQVCPKCGTITHA